MSEQDAPDPRVDRYLRGLPDALPPPGLGDRVVALHLARRARRRWVPWLAAASLFMGVLVWQQRGPDATLPPPVVTAVPAPALVEVRSVDRRLQAAYLSGASEAELDGLWQARRQALAALQSETPESSHRQVRL